MDQSKKTMRHFYCRDVLWETFEQMANDFDCSIDYLVNESMRYYARSKNYGGADAKPPTGISQGPSAGAKPNTLSGGSRPDNRPQPATLAPPRKPPAPTPGYANPGVGPSMPPSAAPIAPPPPVSNGSGPTLFLVYNGQRFPVTKDQFIIGRGSKSSDLAIKDGNISRKHAAVIRRNGTFYIKDLGSTNGIDYKGMRIDNKRIDEGDIFHLCDYELRFTYRGD
jgi:hypothetical protein